MLVIRDSQLSVFARGTFSRFQDAMVRHIETCFPGKYAVLGEAKAVELVRAAVRTGMENDIQTRGAVIVLLELMLKYGELFELSPDQAWALKILRHPSLPAHLKVDTIRDRFDYLLQGRQIVPLQTE